MNLLGNNIIDKIVEGRLVTHAHDEFNWRLRDMVNHPEDPNWNQGTYSLCHEDLRFNSNLQHNTIIFDLVRRKENRHPIIRSAFVINKIDNGVIYFDSFLFADGEPIEIEQNLYRTRYGDIISKKECIILLSKMSKSYNRYQSGQKPKYISGFDWERMKLAALQSTSKVHRCS